MQKSEGAVIRMQKCSDLEYVVGNENILEQMQETKSLSIFSLEAENFLQALSQRLLHSADVKRYPDVVTFAFWCRKASILRMAEMYANAGYRQGRGIVFHIAPSNVAVNFAYSFAVAILAGNASIVRLPSKDFEQVTLICDAIKAVLNETETDFNMAGYICMLKYGHNRGINDRFSALCDIRVVWGGNHTIAEIRQSPLKARAGEITFADRFSIAVIDGDAYLTAADKIRIAHDFFNDTYLTDQNACTSPHIVIWLGEHVEKARSEFWETLGQLVGCQYTIQSVQAVDKLTDTYLLGANYPAELVPGTDNRMVRVQVQLLTMDIMQFRGNSGFFIEYITNSLKDILPVCTEGCQTLSYYGIQKECILDFIKKNRPKGIDRIVPIGHTMDFDLLWDGHDLIREMSRIIGY